MDAAQAAVDAALSAGADYADARVNRLSRESLGLRNGAVGTAEAPEELGIGVRVLKDGAWGFAAAPTMPGDALGGAPAVAQRALNQDAGPEASVESAD